MAEHTDTTNGETVEVSADELTEMNAALDDYETSIYEMRTEVATMTYMARDALARLDRLVARRHGEEVTPDDERDPWTELEALSARVGSAERALAELTELARSAVERLDAPTSDRAQVTP